MAARIGTPSFSMDSHDPSPGRAPRGLNRVGLLFVLSSDNLPTRASYGLQQLVLVARTVPQLGLPGAAIFLLDELGIQYAEGTKIALRYPDNTLPMFGASAWHWYELVNQSDPIDAARTGSHAGGLFEDDYAFSVTLSAGELAVCAGGNPSPGGALSRVSGKWSQPGEMPHNEMGMSTWDTHGRMGACSMLADDLMAPMNYAFAYAVLNDGPAMSPTVRLPPAWAEPALPEYAFAATGIGLATPAALPRVSATAWALGIDTQPAGCVTAAFTLASAEPTVRPPGVWVESVGVAMPCATIAPAPTALSIEAAAAGYVTVDLQPAVSEPVACVLCPTEYVMERIVALPCVYAEPDVGPLRPQAYGLPLVTVRLPRVVAQPIVPPMKQPTPTKSYRPEVTRAWVVDA